MIDSFTSHIHAIDGAGDISGWMGMRLWMKQVMCRHDMLPHFEPTRMCMRCTTCGHETPGWEIDAKRRRVQ